ncbi:hypothetical protein [Streptomyces sp. NBC_00878]|uniref:hypothetical protein n=1 Tax=Streptomyces sp. NBC_00878 TaxID=2975854 RepID=UPI00225908BA|nr:hypothetical protein [Streptomyces sp. NBC_00878]MCX4911332.1 hypothetical protein [Streptomyces sp. NBC_00878]
MTAQPARADGAVRPRPTTVPGRALAKLSPPTAHIHASALTSRRDPKTGGGHCLAKNSGTLPSTCGRHRRRTIKCLRLSPTWADREVPV